ncbi:MAG: DUF4910 domain-containing protein, partial [Alphaproteobacteria bacterium]
MEGTLTVAEHATDPRIEAYFDRLWPLPRSITGDAVRRTHDILGEILPLQRIEVPSGRQVFDWTIPPEWVLREAYIIDPAGRRRCDVRQNNLHLVGYSMPFRGTLSRAELDAHLFSDPNRPDAVPYVTSYYERRWGFCLSHRERSELPEGDYTVVVDTAFDDCGSLTISEAVVPGTTEDEVVLVSHTCHPSMANDQLSGPLVTAFLHERIARWPDRRLTYRFVFLPETIGSLAYIHMREAQLRRHLVGGYVLALLGGPGPFTYRQSRRGDSAADRAALAVLPQHGETDIRAFRPAGGNDQRQFCAPGFDFPVGCITHTPEAKGAEYHSSLDNKAWLSFPALMKSIDAVEQVCRALDTNIAYRNLKPFGEPQLSKYGLYPSTGLSGLTSLGDFHRAVLWLLNYSDGMNDLLSIS